MTVGGTLGLMGKTFVGVSGWTYESWHGPFYPADLPKARELEYASRQFNSIEINGSFYGLLKPETYRRWYEQTPRGFVFSVKGSRFITHNKKLKDAKTPLANFFASGLLLLKEKLGPILWQLPENLRFDTDRVEGFLELLPRNTQDAARLARKHDQRVKGRSWFQADAQHHLRHAIEVRHESFLTPEFVRVARSHGVALVFADSGQWPYVEELTAGFVYLRLHGSPNTYASRYGDKRLDAWSERIRKWRTGSEPSDADRITDRKPPRRKSRDVYVYFDNDQNAHAPRDALGLAERVS